jgi:putative membrane protein
MSNTKVATVKQRSLAKGLIAGLAGGLVGAVAMAVAERMFPPAAQGQSEPQTPPEPIHWGFGVAVGGAYGVVAEFFPAATAKEGATFGMALEGLAQRGALPMLGKPVAADGTTREIASEMTSRVVYGLATETVRGFVRKRL